MARPKEFERDQALQAAMQVFWMRGFRGASVQDLLDAMGINRGSLYDTFGDKRELFRAALQRYELTVLEPLLADLERPELPGLEAVRRTLARIVEDLAGRGAARGSLLTTSAVEVCPSDRGLTAQVSRAMGRIEDAFHCALARAQDAGELAPTQDPRALARYLGATVNGLWVIGRTRPGRRVLQGIATTALSSLGEGRPASRARAS
jgi:TetR/AcrR family transcriptional repressor of nem operon